MAFATIVVVSQRACHRVADLDPHYPSTIISDCIIPRIEKMIASFEQNRPMGPRRNPLGANEPILEKKYENRVAHIELMVYLVKNCESFGPKFWASIAKWQIETHRRFCEKLLRDYRDATYDILEDKDGVEVFIAALESAVKRAHALPEPDPEKARFSDAFSIRNLYDDQDVKALIVSDRFTPEKRLELQEAVEELLLDQPVFPPECYALQQM